MGSAIVKKLKTMIPGMVGDYPSAAKVYRERGGTPILDETGAVRMRYDDLPDMHQLQTGEETKAVDLDAIIQKYESDSPDDAVHIIEDVSTPDGEKRDLVLEGVKKYDSGSRIDRAAEKLKSVHRVEKEEETKPVKLSEMIEKFESEGPEYADYVVAGVEGPDGKKRDMLLRGVVDRGQVQGMSRMGGTPTVHFYEAESGQLINWLPKFVDTEELDGDLHEKVRKADNPSEVDRYDIPDGIKSPTEVGIRPYLIDNKDERLTAWMDHLKKKFEKYSGSEGFWQEHFEVAMVLAVGFSIAMIYYAVLPNLGELIPIANQIMGDLNTIAPNVEQLAGSVTEGSSGGGTGGAPPGN